jgi:(S)-ureidoglycine aminohydrolase
MSSLFGETRTSVANNHALIAPDGHVTSPLTGWLGAEGVVLISPALRGGQGGPRFVQYLVNAADGCSTSGAAAGVERLLYVLQGKAMLEGATLGADAFAWFPPDDTYALTVVAGTRLLVFEKPYQPLAGVAPPQRVTGSLSTAPREAFMGDPQAMLATLLPIEPAFDMAINVFTFQPGTPLPFVETHVMEHGLYMKQGQGVYRLGDRWYPVQAGDSIWMASYCPQWFVAIGTEAASYIYYKDIHREPLFPCLPAEDSLP